MPNNSSGSHIYSLSDGGYFVTSTNNLVRLDGNGNFMFGNKYTSFFSGNVQSLIEDGPYVVFCLVNDGAVIKIDKMTGAQVWANNIPANNIIKAGNGYIASVSIDTTTQLFKLDANGNILDSKKIYLLGTTSSGHKMIATDANGSFVLMCNRYNWSPFVNNSIYLGVFDSSFNHKSSAKGNNSSLILNGDVIVTDGNGNLVIGGNTRGVVTNMRQYMLLYKVKLSDLSNNCVLSQNTSTVRPGLQFVPGISDYTQQGITVTVSPFAFADSVFNIVNMKRRSFIKSSITCALAPFVFSKSSFATSKTLYTPRSLCCRCNVRD